MKRKYYLLLIVAFIFPFIANAQDENYKKGYIITNEGKQKDGWIDFRIDKINATECRFKKTESEGVEVYSPSEIKGYVLPVENKHYVSRDITIDSIQRKCFLEYLVEGQMNLFYMVNKENNQKYYFFEGNDGTMTIITKIPDKIVKYSRIQDEKYKGVLRYIFKDYPDLKEYINSTKYFSQQEMIGLAKKYHEETCTTGQKCIIYENQKADNLYLKFNFSIYGGVQFTKYSFDKNSLSKLNSDTYTSPMLGIRLFLTNARWSKAFSYGIDASIFQLKSFNKYKIQDESGLNVTSNNFEYKSIMTNIRIGAKYVYLHHKVKPTIEFGVSNLLAMKNKATLVSKVSQIDKPNSGSMYTSNPEMPSYYIGAYLSVGIDYPVGKHFLFLNAVYEFNTSVTPPDQANNSIQSPHLKLGFTL